MKPRARAGAPVGSRVLQAGGASRLGTHDVVELQLLLCSLLNRDVFTCPAVEGCFHMMMGLILWVAFITFLLFLTLFTSLPVCLHLFLHHA